MSQNCGSVNNNNSTHNDTMSSQNNSPVKGAPNASTAETSTPCQPVLHKTRMTDLIRDIDPNISMDDEVEEILLSYVDEFVDRVLNGSSMLAKHRRANKIEVKDVQLFMNRNYNIWVPGFGTDELKPYKRSAMTDAHKQRLALIRRAIKKY